MTRGDFRAEMARRSLTQAAVADMLGVSQSMVSRDLSGTGEVGAAYAVLAQLWQGRPLSLVSAGEVSSLPVQVGACWGALVVFEDYTPTLEQVGADLVTWGLVRSYDEGYGSAGDWMATEEGREALAGAAALGGSLAVRDLCARWIEEGR